MQDRAEEYGGFLKFVIEAGGVTKPDGQQGGIVLMGSAFWKMHRPFQRP